MANPEIENYVTVGDTLAPTTDRVLDEDTYFNVKGDPMAAKFVAGLKARDEKRRAALAEPGSLGLSPLLDQRRLIHQIPDEAFREQPIYDRIFVFQISMWGDRDTYGDTQIVMTNVTQDAEKHSNPRGILIAAGPLARDELKSNGCDLGHVVTFIKLAPWRLQVGSHGGHDVHIMILRSCDIIASEDLARQLREGTKKIEEFVVRKDNRAFITHVITDAVTGATIHPLQPTIPEDY